MRGVCEEGDLEEPGELLLKIILHSEFELKTFFIYTATAVNLRFLNLNSFECLEL